MDFLHSFIAFVVAIGVLVTVHEFGHFWVARRLGVKVLRFSVGFGRPLWSRRWGADQTEYVVAMIPFGGYVKMLDEREAPVSGTEAGRAFNRQSLAVRSAIVLAGPAANFLFAVVAYWVMFMVGVTGLRALVGEVAPGSLAERGGLRAGQQVVAVDGEPTPSWEGVAQRIIGGTLGEGLVRLEVLDAAGRRSEAQLDLSRVSLDDMTEGRFFDAVGITPARPTIPPRIGRVEAGGPAARDGLRPGDLVLTANGDPVDSWTRWVEIVRAHPERDLALTVRRQEREVPLTLRPAEVEIGGERAGRIGAGADRVEEQLGTYYVLERHDPLTSMGRALAKTVEISALTVNVFWKMLRLEVSFKNLSGPISIAQYAGYSAAGGTARFLEFLALVSVSLGILNLLPIPVLDGGHLLFNLIEAVKGGPLSEQAQAYGQQLGIALLVGLMSLAFYNDLARLLG